MKWPPCYIDPLTPCTHPSKAWLKNCPLVKKYHCCQYKLGTSPSSQSGSQSSIAGSDQKLHCVFVSLLDWRGLLMLETHTRNKHTNSNSGGPYTAAHSHRPSIQDLVVSVIWRKQASFEIMADELFEARQGSDSRSKYRQHSTAERWVISI